jgi:hypothetical protein
MIHNQYESNSAVNLRADSENFNFDIWAREVKRRMMASIKKRDYKEWQGRE